MLFEMNIIFLRQKRYLNMSGINMNVFMEAAEEALEVFGGMYTEDGYADVPDEVIISWCLEYACQLLNAHGIVGNDLESIMRECIVATMMRKRECDDYRSNEHDHA